jgi:hypothetical protein
MGDNTSMQQPNPGPNGLTTNNEDQDATSRKKEKPQAMMTKTMQVQQGKVTQRLHENPT